MKRALLTVAILAAAGAVLVLGAGAANSPSLGSYKIQFDNAFGLVTGADFKVAGVKAGTIKSIDLDQRTLHAVVTVNISQAGFGQFRSDAFCQSRPQSLIGEYFVECQPGQSGRVLKAGSTLPVTQTQSTIPADLLQNVMRMPYRERLTLIINELGAAVAGRSEDLKAALRRAVPALTETDNLLNLLANDSNTLQSLTVNSDQVITALANNSVKVTRFIDEANRLARVTATQQVNLRSTLANLPGFLEQLRPSLAQLGGATDANTPVLRNLNAAATQLNRLLVDLPGFSHSALPAIQSLGQASVTGKAAVRAATPTVSDLNAFAKPTPELAQNLNIVLHALDNRSRAVEADSRSPGGKGYTGLEALLQYVFNQALAINTFGPFGHLLAVDLFASNMCSPYATPATIAQALKIYGPTYRSCYSWLGPNQPGVTTTDPSNPTACVPDPGGAPPGYTGAHTTACKLTAAAAARDLGSAASAPTTTLTSLSATPGSSSSGAAASGGGSSGAASAAGTSSGGAGAGAPSAGASTPGSSGSSSRPTLGQTLGSAIGGAVSPSSGQTSADRGKSSSQTQQLLNYLLAP